MSKLSDTLKSWAEWVSDTEALPKQLTEARMEAAELRAQIGQVQSQLQGMQAAVDAAASRPNLFPFSIQLEADRDRYADESWKKAVKGGQELQKPYWERFEKEYGAKYGEIHGPGWHGSAHMPVIQIVCTEPEYRFRETQFLPPRFQLTTPARWGSILRWESGTIKDTIPWGTATGSPIGLVVQGPTKVDGMMFRPFEQGIEKVAIQATNDVLPVYLEHNQDRFWMDRVKILQREGALLGIKHGPMLDGTGDRRATWLTDPRFINLQMEGPQSQETPQAVMLLSGANIMIQNLNLYDWRQGPVCQVDDGLVINGLTMHQSGYGPTDQRPFVVSNNPHKRTNGAVFSAINARQNGLYLPKGSTNKQLGGWYSAEGRVL